MHGTNIKLLYSVFHRIQNYTYTYGVSDGEKLIHVRVVFVTVIIMIRHKYIKWQSVEGQQA
jgi:hypothetical protein